MQQPDGILGVIETIPHAGQINALSTLNLRPATLKSWGFDERKARSMTDAADDDPAMPDALEIAAAQDAEFARTGKLAGPLHGVVMAIKDQYDTFDIVLSYDTERIPRGSSSGSGFAVGANLVTCAIAEESGSSIRGPASAASTVGIAATEELVSRDGMIQIGINTRVAPSAARWRTPPGCST